MKIPFYLLLFKTFGAQKRAVRPEMQRLGLSPGQPKILDFLAGTAGCIQKDLASSCDIEPATVSKLLDNMEASGLIVRKEKAGDRRSVLITLTDAGRAAQQAMERYFAGVERKTLKGFDKQEAEAFYSYLRRAYINLSGKEPDWKRGEHHAE